ncbi:MAG: hypothetical protein WA622_27025 [Mycobacterium sp.]|uniref:hypothetical protein n=1 Tax=Mycobacterium sp. TaxID=1785 RepID=UPI003CB44C05
MIRSLAEVAGAKARDLRLDAGKSLEDVAAAARAYGSRWSSGSVGDFEAGRTALTLPTLLVALAALGDVVGRPLDLTELLAGRENVAINPDLSISLSKLREMLSGKAAVTFSAVKIPVGAESGLRIWPMRLGLDNKLHWRVLNEFRESDKRICKSLGVDPDAGAAAMALLWKKTFTAKRDEQAPPDAKAQRRGHISRQLKSELRDKLQELGEPR